MKSNISMDLPLHYRIRVSGAVNEQWFAYYDTMIIEEEYGEGIRPLTTLTGQVPDQAALIGMLNLLYDMHCPLLSLECFTPEESNDRKETE